MEKWKKEWDKWVAKIVAEKEQALEDKK